MTINIQRCFDCHHAWEYNGSMNCPKCGSNAVDNIHNVSICRCGRCGLKFIPDDLNCIGPRVCPNCNNWPVDQDSSIDSM